MVHGPMDRLASHFPKKTIANGGKNDTRETNVVRSLFHPLFFWKNELRSFSLGLVGQCTIVLSPR